MNMKECPDFNPEAPQGRMQIVIEKTCLKNIPPQLSLPKYLPLKIRWS